MFFYSAHGIHLILLVYVDDIIVTGNLSTAISDLMHALGKEFVLKDLGPLNYFLGIEVTRTSSGLILSQQKYIRQIIT